MIDFFPIRDKLLKKNWIMTQIVKKNFSQIFNQRIKKICTFQIPQKHVPEISDKIKTGENFHKIRFLFNQMVKMTNHCSSVHPYKNFSLFIVLGLKSILIVSDPAEFHLLSIL